MCYFVPDMIFDSPSDAGVTPDHRRLGQEGERLAARFLDEHGYRLVVANFTVPVGRNTRGAEVTGELDLVALDGETLCFVEVKTRRSNELFEPSAAVTLRKQRQITRTAKIYRRLCNVFGMPYRDDVVSVLKPAAGDPSIELIKGFWDDSKFKKRSWSREIYNDLT